MSCHCFIENYPHIKDGTTRALYDDAKREEGIDDLGVTTPRKKRRNNPLCKEVSIVVHEDFTNAIKVGDDVDKDELLKEAILNTRAERVQAELTKDLTTIKFIESAKKMAEAANDADERAKYMTIVQKYMDKLSE